MGVNYAIWTDVTKVAPIALPAAVETRGTEYIVQASVRLRSLVAGLDERLADGRVEADLVKGLVVDAVLRLLYNPMGAQQQSAGPFNMSHAGGVAADNIMFSEEQLKLLLRD